MHRKPVILLLLSLFIVCPGFARDSLNVFTIGVDQAWSEAECIGIKEASAFVGTIGEDMRIFNIARPENPVLLTTFRTGPVYKIDFLQRYAVLAGGENGWSVIDVDSPSEPQQVCHVEGDVVNDLVVTGIHVIIGTEAGELKCFSLNNQWEPEETGRLERLSSVSRIILTGDTAYVSTVNGLVIADISDLSSPRFISRCPERGNYTDFVIGNGLAYLIDSPDTLRIVNISDIGDPRETWTVPLRHPAYKALFDGRFLYIGAGSGQGFNVLDCWDPDNPDTGSYVESTFGVVGMTIDGSHLWTTGAGITSYSLVQPGSPSQVGHTGYSGSIVDIDMMGQNDAMILRREGGLVVQNVSDRRNPQATNFHPYDPALWGEHPVIRTAEAEFFVAGENELSVGLDAGGGRWRLTTAFEQEMVRFNNLMVDNSGQVVITAGSSGWFKGRYDRGRYSELRMNGRGFTDLPAEATCSFLSPGFVVACRHQNGNRAIVLHYRGEQPPPRSIALNVPPGGKTEILASDENLFLAAGNLFILGINDQDSMVVIGRYEPEAPIEDMQLTGDFLVLLEGTRRVTILNVMSPTHPFMTGFYNFTYDCSAIAMDGDNLFAGGVGDFRVLDIGDALSVEGRSIQVPEEFTIELYPNPFNGVASVKLMLPVKMEGRLYITDPLGRRVEELAEWRGFEAGSHAFKLNSSRLSSGSYCLVFEGQALKKSLQFQIMK